MSLLHKIRDKILSLFGIDDILDALERDNTRVKVAQQQVAELKKKDAERIRFEQELRARVEQYKRDARDRNN